MTPLAEAWFPVVWATQLKAVDRVAAAIREITLLLIVAFAGVHLPHATKPMRFFSGPRGERLALWTLNPVIAVQIRARPVTRMARLKCWKSDQ